MAEKCITIGCSEEAQYMNRCNRCDIALRRIDIESDKEDTYIDYRDIIDPQMQEF